MRTVFTWHWQEGTLPEVLLVHDGFVYDFGDREPTSIGLFDGRGRWLGPIYASDAEQLAELREAARRALTWTEELMLAKPLSEQGDAVTASLRAALNPSHSQEGDTDES